MSIIHYPTLFKRSVSKDKISTWQVVVDGNTFYTISGYKGYKLITSEPTICTAKNIGKSNETTDHQQARAEAEAMHKKRLELGYFLNEAEIDDPVYFKPMLAHKYQDYENKLTYPLYSDEKFDGMRCIIMSTGMWTRNGKKIESALHIFESLKHLFEEDPGLILDGELYTDNKDIDFNKIISCVRKTKPTLKDLLESRNYIKYFIYDVPSLNSNFTDRKLFLNTLSLSQYCIIVDTKVCHNKEELDKYYKQYLEEGFEGQMIRTNSQYENKRSKFLLKRKEWLDDEFEIKGVVQGLGKLYGKVGKLQFEMTDGTRFDAPCNGTHEYLAELWEKRDILIGQIAVVKYFEITTDGSLRFPKVVDIGRHDI